MTMTKKEPVRSRPHVPGYGLPEADEGMLAWSYVTERLSAASAYWVATTGADGRPHAVPYWGGWVDEKLYFETAPTTRGGRNLRTNPAVVVHLENDEQVVIVEGVARTAMPSARFFARVQDAYRPKYDGYVPESSDNLFTVEAEVVFAWDLGEFPGSMTRWTFAGRGQGSSSLGD